MSFEYYIDRAVKEINNRNFEKAEQYIHMSMIKNDFSPKYHNLLGIIAEITGNLSLAGKHYRAAYSLQPTFKAASINLERITHYNYKFDYKKIDFGNKVECIQNIPYTVQYDSHNVGHIIKNPAVLK